MSIKVMTWVWESNLKPMERLVALAYADHADHDGNNIYPSLNTVAAKTGLARSNVVRIRKRLEADGVMVVTAVAHNKPTRFRIDRAALEAIAPSDPQSPVDKNPSSDPQSLGSDPQSLELVTHSHPSSDCGSPNPSITVNKTISEPSYIGADAPSGTKTPAVHKKKEPDPRTQHPAIQAIRKVTGRYPDLSLYDKVIQSLGPVPDLDKLGECRGEWVDRGYNRSALKWATDWYVNGIPERVKPSTNGNGNGRINARGRVAADGTLEPAGFAALRELMSNGSRHSQNQ